MPLPATLVARREDQLRDLAAELSGSVRVEVVACDVSDPDARAGLLDEVERRGLQADTWSTTPVSPRSGSMWRP